MHSYDKGDAVSLEKVKDIIRSELQKGVINQQKIKHEKRTLNGHKESILLIANFNAWRKIFVTYEIVAKPIQRSGPY